MAKTPRVTSKIFASKADPNTIGQFGSALSGTKVTTGDISEIQALPAYEAGWSKAVISKRNYPTLQEMNGLQKTFSQQIDYILQEGVAEYDAGTTYYKGSWCKGIDEQGNRKLYESLVDENLGHPVTDISYWQELSFGSGGAGAPIGSLFPTFCAADFTPNNCLPCNGSEYSSSQFPSFYTNYLTGGRLLTCTYEEYASSLSTYGKCAKFAVDATVGTFKTPYLPDGSFIQQAMSAEELGKLYKAGLPDFTLSGTTSSNGAHTHSRGTMEITGAFNSGRTNESSQISGAFYRDSATQGFTGGGSDSGYKLNFKASRNWTGSTSSNGAHTHTMTFSSPSGTVYGNSTTVQPESVALRWFVVVGTGSINEADMDWSAWATSLNGRASTDLTNLTPEGEKHFVNKFQITNCILEAPQRIKVVYEGSDIVIKAGTVAIVPSGFEEDGTTPKFEEYTLEQDIIVPKDISQAYFMGLNFSENGTNTWRRVSSGCYTGPTAPASPVNYDIWYDTSANIIRRYDGTQWYVQKFSLPIASIDGSKYSITSVFNAIGGFGTTFFIPKGVKFLMPNGKNQDGTLNNLEYITDRLKINTDSAFYTGMLQYAMSIDSNGDIATSFTSRCYSQDFVPTINPNSGNEFWYNPSTNLITEWNLNVPKVRPICVFPLAGTVYNGKLSSVFPNNCLNLLSEANRKEITGWYTPSTTYVDLELGASNTTYIMPADGWLQAACTGTTAGQVYFELTSDEISACASYNGGWGRCSIPVRAEQKIIVHYGGAGFSKKVFRFTYAKGALL